MSVNWSEGACKARTRDVNFPRGPGGGQGHSVLCVCGCLSTFTPVFQVKFRIPGPKFWLLSARRRRIRGLLHQRELGFVVLPMGSASHLSLVHFMHFARPYVIFKLWWLCCQFMKISGSKRENAFNPSCSGGPGRGRAGPGQKLEMSFFHIVWFWGQKWKPKFWS